MNNPKLDNLTSQLQQTHMTESEKTELREKLLTFISEHPAPTKAIPGGFWLLRQRSLAFSLTLTLILIVTVSSASYAAEFSLPGEALYGLKVNLTEPLRGSLQSTPQAQAEWNGTLVERRLNEAHVLAEKGNLAGEAESEIVRRLTMQTDKARASVVQVSTHDTLAAAELNSRLEATLQIGQEVFTTRSQRQTTNKTSASEQLHESLAVQASSTQALSVKLETEWNKSGDDKDLAEHTAQLQQRLMKEQDKLERPQPPKTAIEQQRAEEIARKLKQAQALIATPTTTPDSATEGQRSIRQLQQALKLEHEAQLLNTAERSPSKNQPRTKQEDHSTKDDNNNREKSKKSSE